MKFGATVPSHLVVIAAFCSLIFPVTCAAGSVTQVGDMTQPTMNHSTVRLPSGQVLAVATTGRAELFDPLNSSWRLTGSMAHGTIAHQAMSLSDGRVWVAGGESISASSSATDRVEIYDEALGTWVPGTSLGIPRTRFTANRMPDGSLLVAGGVGKVAGVLGTPTVEVDRFSPDTATRSVGPPLPSARYGHTATLASNGDLIVLGGFDAAGQPSDTCFRLPSAASAFSACAVMPSARAGHHAVLLDTGNILVLGAAPSGVTVESVYNPTTDQWVATTFAASQADNQTVIPRNGNSILVWGGVLPAQLPNILQPKRYFSQYDYTGYLFWADINNATSLATFGAHAATELADGRTLISGGSDTVTCLIPSGLGCLSYGLGANTKTYVVDKQPFTGGDFVLYGRVPSDPRIRERYRVDTWSTGSWNPVAAVGNLSISDGSASCSVTRPGTSCYLTTVATGPKTYSFNFAGDAEYLPRTWSTSRPPGDRIRIERIGAAGVVSASAGGSGILCAISSPFDFHNCDAPIAAGSTHTLTSSAPSGYTFVGWQGVCAGSGPTCTFTAGASGSSVVKVYFAATADLPFRIDLDESGTANALSDGLVLAKYMLDSHDSPLLAGLTASYVTTASPQALEDKLNLMRPLLDLDKDGAVDAQTDGVLFLRYMLGIRGTALTNSALGVGARVTDPDQIGAAIQALVP